MGGLALNSVALLIGNKGILSLDTPYHSPWATMMLCMDWGKGKIRAGLTDTKSFCLWLLSIIKELEQTYNWDLQKPSAVVQGQVYWTVGSFTSFVRAHSPKPCFIHVLFPLGFKLAGCPGYCCLRGLKLEGRREERKTTTLVQYVFLLNGVESLLFSGSLWVQILAPKDVSFESCKMCDLVLVNDVSWTSDVKKW